MAANGSDPSPRLQEKRELGSLNSRLEAYVSQMRRLSADRDRLQEKVRQLMEDHDQTMEDRESKHADETDALNKQIRVLAAKAREAETECERLRAELRTLAQETDGWEAIRDERDMLKSQLKASREQEQRTADHLENAEKARDSYMQQNMDSAARVKDLELELANVRARFDRTNDDLDAAHATIRRLTEDMNQADGSAEEAQMTIRELREAIAELKTSVAAREAEIEALKDAAASAAARARETIAALKDDNDRLRRAVEDGDAKAIAANQRAADAESKALAAEAARREDATAAQRRLEQQAAAMAALRSAHATDVARLEGRIHDAEAAVADARRQAVQDSAAQVRALQEEKSLLEEELQSYRSILEQEEARVGLPTPQRRNVERLLSATNTSATAPRRRNADDDDDDDEEEDEEDNKGVSKRRREPATIPAKRVARNTRSHGPARVVTSHAPGSAGIALRVDLDQELALVVNEGSEACDLTGWSVCSEAGQQFYFPDGQRVGPGQAVLVWSGPEGQTRCASHDSSFFWTSRPVWNNKGDLARLVDADGEIACEYQANPGDATLDVSAARKRGQGGASSSSSSAAAARELRSAAGAEAVQQRNGDGCVVM